MTTLIAVYNSEGVVGRCDAKCYGAHGGPCTCICGGMNHALGKAKAQANTLNAIPQVKAWVDAHRDQVGDDAVVAAIVPLL